MLGTIISSAVVIVVFFGVFTAHSRIASRRTVRVAQFLPAYRILTTAAQSQENQAELASEIHQALTTIDLLGKPEEIKALENLRNFAQIHDGQLGDLSPLVNALRAGIRRDLQLEPSAAVVAVNSARDAVRQRKAPHKLVPAFSLHSSNTP